MTEKIIQLEDTMARCEHFGNGRDLFQTRPGTINAKAPEDNESSFLQASGSTVDSMREHQQKTGHGIFLVYPNEVQIDPDKPLAVVYVIANAQFALMRKQ